MRNLPLSRPVKSVYQYNNIMYTAATHLVESLAQCSFSAFLHKHVFLTLDMTSTFLQPSAVRTAKQDDRFSTPYFFKDGSYHATYHQERPELQGSGSIQTTVNDFAKFIRAMMNHSSPITAAISEDVTTPRIMRNSKANLEDFGPESFDVAYALGWDVKYYHHTLILTHDGVICGYGSRMFILLHYKIGAYIVGNSAGAYDLSSVIQNKIIDEILGFPEHQQLQSANKRVNRFAAREERREKNVKRNMERRGHPQSSLSIPMDAYTGTYHHDGYHDVTIQIQSGSLVVDGKDRSIPFTMPLERLSGNTRFRGYLIEENGEEGVLPVCFKINPKNDVDSLGIAFEEALGNKHVFWFSKV